MEVEDMLDTPLALSLVKDRNIVANMKLEISSVKTKKTLSVAHAFLRIKGLLI